MKSKGLKTCIRLRKAKETWQQNTKHDSKLDPFVIKDINGTLDKN